MQKKIKLLLLFVITLTLITLVGARGYLVKESSAVQAFETQGFSNIEIYNREVFLFTGCTKHDAARLDAHATNTQGKRVDVYVCMQYPFVGATIKSR